MSAIGGDGYRRLPAEGVDCYRNTCRMSTTALASCSETTHDDLASASRPCIAAAPTRTPSYGRCRLAWWITACPVPAGVRIRMPDYPSGEAFSLKSLHRADQVFDALVRYHYGQCDYLIQALQPALGPVGLELLKQRMIALSAEPIRKPRTNERQFIGWSSDAPSMLTK
jgi:Family of unknown function (DUF6880)